LILDLSKVVVDMLRKFEAEKDIERVEGEIVDEPQEVNHQGSR
jgi:hypothetical protein